LLKKKVQAGGNVPVADPVQAALERVKARKLAEQEESQ